MLGGGALGFARRFGSQECVCLERGSSSELPLLALRAKASNHSLYLEIYYYLLSVPVLFVSVRGSQCLE